MNLPGFENIELSERARELRPAVLSTLKTATARKPVRSAQIESTFGLTGPEIRAIISALRIEGYPIASCGRGYFWAYKSHELDETIEHLEARARKISIVKQALINTVRKMRGMAPIGAKQESFL